MGAQKTSQRDGSFEYPQHMFQLRNKKIIFLVCTLKGDSNINDKYVLSERALSMNNEFWYKYHQNRLKNGEVMGIYRIQYGQHLAAILNI